MREVKSVCCCCGVGCGVILATDAGRITGLRGDPEHPANFGRLCSKGSTLHLTTRQETRLLFPALRASRDAAPERKSWDEVLEVCADRFAEIIDKHGPNSVGFYVSGQLLTEDYYVFNKLAKGLVGTNNIDTNSQLCMSSDVSGYKQTLGSDAPPTCYEDLALAHCVFISGFNTARAHPILFRRIEDAKRADPSLRIIVVDPRRTDTASAADLHLQILPGTDVALHYGMLHVILRDGLLDRDYVAAHTTGFDTLRERVRSFAPMRAAEICGIPVADLVQAAHWFAMDTPTLSLYCLGLNQSTHGTDSNATLIDLHLATGQIGKPGAGPFSLTGEANAMGGREVGGMANLFSAHRNLEDPADRAELAMLWNVPAVPEKPGRTAVEMFEALRTREIKAIWIAGTNPAHSLPHQALVREALAGAEFVVVQEAYADTETTAFADVLLPATAWGEKEGTMTNSERGIAYITPAAFGPGEARADWQIATEFARRLSARLGREDGERLFPYRCAEDVFDEHRHTTHGRDLDITGLSYGLLRSAGPQQWPYPSGASAGRARLYTDGHFATPDGRATFAAPDYQPVAEDVDHAYPLRLIAGRLADHWRGMTRTGTVARLFNHAEEPQLAMHPDDIAARGVEPGDLFHLKGRRGEIILRAAPSAEMRGGLGVPADALGQPVHE